MENYFQINWEQQKINSVTNLGLAHVGDAVFELLCRSYLCCKGGKVVKNLHRDTVAMVNAPSQAKFADKLLPHLTEAELSWFRRGRNAHTHAAPKAATPREYARATGLETLFGALYLSGQLDRLNELFHLIVEEN